MMSSYAVSKATLICLTENLAVEAAADGVVAFAIRPGIVPTAMVEAGLASTLPAIGGFFRQARAEGRMVSADRVAHLVVTLASGRPSTTIRVRMGHLPLVRAKVRFLASGPRHSCDNDECAASSAVPGPLGSAQG